MVVRAFIRAIVAGFGATRYLISWCVLAIVIFYCLLNLLNYVPPYSLLAANAGLAPRWMLGLLYVLVALVAIIANWLLVLRPAQVPPAMMSLRSMYQQTDPTGVGPLNLLILIVALASSLVVIRLFRTSFISDGIVFMAIVLALPVAIDLLPFLRPRRACIPRDGQTIRAIAERLATDRLDPFAVEALTYALQEYNANLLPQQICFDDDDQPDVRAGPVEDRPLHDGIVLNIPPRA